MNKQELIEKFEGRKSIIGCFQGWAVWWEDVKEILEQLDEPEKVVVPQFVADWIRKCKMFKHFAVSLSFALQPIVWEENNLSDKCIDWLMDANNQELFARAWLDGYEVEEEKRYLVTLKNRQPLVKSQSGSTLYFSQDITARNYKGTQKELEDANFGWVFDCPGIEIEEVE
ncbi:phage protein [Streptococcus pneumoniae]|uniref:Phage protein n=1 Tax=Streptococcus pneumoniae TaxID=1313 RepID=A0A4J2B6Z7_STREE|nr:phage protein [Streptococcus pneumoniae]VLZ98033.1 phage protein [Streptococcus pneumoniae]VMB96659.1 phage protein [Streptococcus pneumoniae]VNE06976.1 phage protein [Streptococcus pneumoniae]VNO55582.1 phage protein [Streptococcus pneumoniae]